MGDKHHNEIVETWRTRASSNYEYFDQVENLTAGFWDEGSSFRQLFDKMNLKNIIEIACGQGRHTVLIPNVYDNVIAVDTSVDAIAECKKRYSHLTKLRFVLSEDGSTLPAPDGCVTAVFSFDAMVHFEPLTVHNYLLESSRVLVSGGRGVFHHSNYGGNPTGVFTDSPHWRNYMTKDLLAHFCSRVGLRVLEQIEMDWGLPKLDCISLFEKL